MRHYETLFIITPDIAEEETAEVVEKYSSLLAEQGGVMAKVENWGRRRLAYEVKKFNKGYFVLFDYGAEPQSVTELERNFKIDEQVIRFMTVKQDDFFDPEAVKAADQPEAEEAEEAQAEEPEAAEEKDAGDDDNQPAEEAPEAEAQETDAAKAGE